MYRLSSQTINWMMGALLGQLQLFQAFVDEDVFDADAGRLVEKEEEEAVREVVQRSGYWWLRYRRVVVLGREKLSRREEEREEGEVNEVELYWWL